MVHPNPISINRIKQDLTFLSKYKVVLFGSLYNGNFIEGRSDIDIAVITGVYDLNENVKLWSSFIGKVSPVYDIRIFELFPLYIQIDIIQNYLVLFGDPLDLSEYFYEYRKKWKDMEYRIKENQFKNTEEKQQGIERRKKYLSMKGIKI